MRALLNRDNAVMKRNPWCPWPESNQHSLRNSILSRARLPIPPQGLFATLAGRGEVAKPAEYSGRLPRVNPRLSGSSEARMPVVRTPSPRLHAWQQPDATGAGVNRFRVIDRIKHPGVIALRLDSAIRAG
jgi:hypothetical protein